MFSSQCRSGLIPKTRSAVSLCNVSRRQRSVLVRAEKQTQVRQSCNTTGIAIGSLAFNKTPWTNCNTLITRFCSCGLAVVRVSACRDVAAECMSFTLLVFIDALSLRTLEQISFDMSDDGTSNANANCRT